MNLTGHTILITGGGKGIGGGLAEAFHQKGNKVIITGRNKKTLEEMAAKFPGMETFTMDVAQDNDVQKLFDFISRSHPSLDVLVNNAGVMKWQDFAGLKGVGEGLFDEIEINLKGLIRVTTAFLPLLLRQKEAVLLNISSALAYMPLAVTPVYCATKAAVHSFSMSLRHQLRGTPVRVVELVPPGVKSELGETPGMPDRGYSMISLESFIAKTMQALGSNRGELPIGQAKLFRLVSRLAPPFAFKFLNH